MLPVLTRAMNTRHLRLENVQLREAVAIHELSETIAFTLDPQTVLSKLADGALAQSEADEVSILLPTSEAVRNSMWPQCEVKSANGCWASAYRSRRVSPVGSHASARR